MQTTTDNKISSLDSQLKEITGNQSTPLISEQLEELNRKMNDTACIISDMSERVEKEPKNAELKAKYDELFAEIALLHTKKRLLLRHAREVFMDIFRIDEFHDIVSVDDAHEVFAGVLHGERDFTKEFLDEIFSDYSVGDIEIVECKK